MAKRSNRPQGGGKEASVTKYRTMKLPGHPLAQADGKIYVHRAVLFKKIGPGSHGCHWCKSPVSWRRPGKLLVADHLDGDRWNNDQENLVPSCFYCNQERAHNPRFLTNCRNGHRYTPKNTYQRAGGTRACKTCRRLAFVAFQERRGS